jgi:hypothetical protein
MLRTVEDVVIELNEKSYKLKIIKIVEIKNYENLIGVTNFY